jgi:hypothetical protein
MHRGKQPRSLKKLKANKLSDILNVHWLPKETRMERESIAIRYMYEIVSNHVTSRRILCETKVAAEITDSLMNMRGTAISSQQRDKHTQTLTLTQFQFFSVIESWREVQYRLCNLWDTHPVTRCEVNVVWSLSVSLTASVNCPRRGLWVWRAFPAISSVLDNDDRSVSYRWN